MVKRPQQQQTQPTHSKTSQKLRHVQRQRKPTTSVSVRELALYSPTPAFATTEVVFLGTDLLKAVNGYVWLRYSHLGDIQALSAQNCSELCAKAVSDFFSEERSNCNNLKTECRCEQKYWVLQCLKDNIFCTIHI